MLCAFSESTRPSRGLPTIRYGNPTVEPENRHSSSITPSRRTMEGSNEGAALSELARRILRSSGVNIIHNGDLEDEIESLCNDLSDKAPKIIFGVSSEIKNTLDIYFENKDSKNGVISTSPPTSLETVWIKGGIEKWDYLRKQILELGRAGYPGCVGCAGPAASEPWDEEASRRGKI